MSEKHILCGAGFPPRVYIAERYHILFIMYMRQQPNMTGGHMNEKR